MYSAGGDESFDETKSRVVSVAGVYGSQKDWADLKGPWEDRLGGKIFHATECETNQGEFASYSDPENKALYKDLTTLVCRSRLLGSGHTVDVAGMREFYPFGELEIPYMVCFRNVITDIGNATMLFIPQGTMEVTFDTRAETNYNAGFLYDQMVRSTAWKATPLLHDKISFASRRYLGIQVADLIAREAMKDLDNRIGPVKRPRRRSMDALLSTGRFRFVYFPREFFMASANNAPDLRGKYGITGEDYTDWLNRKRLSDNLSNRHRYMYEKIPTHDPSHGMLNPNFAADWSNMKR